MWVDCFLKIIFSDVLKNLDACEILTQLSAKYPNFSVCKMYWHIICVSWLPLWKKIENEVLGKKKKRMLISISHIWLTHLFFFLFFKVYDF